jgi:hypothetical protein
MQREANIIDLLNIHRDLFQSLALIREGGGRDLVEAEEEIEMDFKEDSIKIEIQIISLISKSLFKIMVDILIRELKINKNLKVF